MQALQLSGKSQFPYMVDPNTGTSMLESDSIINYLWQVGPPPPAHGVKILVGRVLCRQGCPPTHKSCARGHLLLCMAGLCSNMATCGSRLLKKGQL